MFFLTALLLGIIGALPALISKETSNSAKIIAFSILTIIYTGFSWWILWGCLFSTAWPLFGMHSFIVLACWIISAFVSGIMSETIYYSAWFPVGLLILIIIKAASGAAMFGNTDEYASLIGKFETKKDVHWSQEIQPLDPTHLRLVPDVVAIRLAQTALSENGVTLGSQYPLASDYTTLQKIKGDYYYLIPLDFKGWRVWTNSKEVPAYVKVSATDPKAKPVLVNHLKMKYTPGAWFENNLERFLYAKYKNKVLRDFSFEEDDNGNVFWIISVCKPTIAYGALVVEGVIVLDPQNGNEKFLNMTEVNSKKYAWIDRVIPKDIVENYIDNWGDLKGGWWNSTWDHVNVLEAETPTMNYSADGRCVFVTPVTSEGKNNTSMTGLMYTDARTGVSTYYTVSGGSTEEDIINSVNASVSFKHWVASEQIIYENVYGQLAALVPVLGSSGTYQGLAIVEIKNRSVALGSTPQEALIEFEKIVMGSGAQFSTESTKQDLEYTGKVKRIGWEISSNGKQYYLYFDGFSNSFMITSAVQSELALTEVGDSVYVKYIDSKQASVPVKSFKNLTLNLTMSSNEKSVKNQMDKRSSETDLKSDVKDFKEKVKGMSDEEIQKIIKK